MAAGKQYRAAAEKVDRDRAYPLREGLTLLLETKQWAPTPVDVSARERKADEDDKQSDKKLKKRASVSWLRKWLKND